MSIVKIAAAFEKKLKALDTNFATARENVEFVPVSGTPYQRIKLLPAQPENPTIGGNHYREVGYFEITLFYPINTNRGIAQAKAEAIKAHFKRATALTENGLTVVVARTPAISPAITDGDRYAIPISINYYSDLIS